MDSRWFLGCLDREYFEQKNGGKGRKFKIESGLFIISRVASSAEL